MRRRLPRLVPESLIYGLGGVANQTVAILLVPIYARQLGAPGVGVSAVVNTTVALSLMLVGLALPHAFFRWFLSEANDDRDRAHVVGTTLGVQLISSVLGAAAVTVAVIPLTLLLYGDASYLPVFLTIGPIVFFDSLGGIPLSVLRAQRRPRAYSLISVTRASLGTVAILYLVVVADLGVLGIVIGSAISAMVSLGIGLLVLRQNGLLRWSIDRRLAAAMLAFCLPLVPAALGGWALNLSDRYILQAYTDAETVGIYAMGYTGGLLINALVVQPFVLAWAAAAWEMAREEDAPKQYAAVLTAFAAIGSLAALGLSAIGTDAFRILVGPEFDASRFVVPFSAFAYVLYGVYSITAIGLDLRSQTRWLPLTVGGAAVVAIVLNILLIPLVGFLGAAIATLASYALLTVWTARIGQRYYPVPWDIPRVTAVFIIGFALSAAALLGPDHAAWRLMCVAVYPALLVVFRITPPGALRAAWHLVRRRGSANPPAP